MKKLSRILILLGLMFAISSAKAAVIYELSSRFASLEFESPSFVDKNRVIIPASDLLSCTALGGVCRNIYFDEDFGADLLNLAVVATNGAGITYAFYFPLNTFATFGRETTIFSPAASLEVIDTNPGNLVPEPGALELVGLGLLGLMMRRNSFFHLLSRRSSSLAFSIIEKLIGRLGHGVAFVRRSAVDAGVIDATNGNSTGHAATRVDPEETFAVHAIQLERIDARRRSATHARRRPRRA